MIATFLFVVFPSYSLFFFPSLFLVTYQMLVYVGTTTVTTTSTEDRKQKLRLELFFVCVLNKSFSYAIRVFLSLKRIWYVHVQVIRAHFSRKRTKVRTSLSNYFFARVTNSKLFLPCFQLLLLVSFFLL